MPSLHRPIKADPRRSNRTGPVPSTSAIHVPSPDSNQGHKDHVQDEDEEDVAEKGSSLGPTGLGLARQHSGTGVGSGSGAGLWLKSSRMNISNSHPAPSNDATSASPALAQELQAEAGGTVAERFAPPSMLAAFVPLAEPDQVAGGKEATERKTSVNAPVKSAAPMNAHVEMARLQATLKATETDVPTGKKTGSDLDEERKRSSGQSSAKGKTYHIPASSLSGALTDLSALGIYIGPTGGPDKYKEAHVKDGGVDLDLSFDFISSAEESASHAAATSSPRGSSPSKGRPPKSPSRPNTNLLASSSPSSSYSSRVMDVERQQHAQLAVPIVSLTSPSPAKSSSGLTFSSPAPSLRTRPAWFTDGIDGSPERYRNGNGVPTHPRGMAASANWLRRTAKKPPAPLALESPVKERHRKQSTKGELSGAHKKGSNHKIGAQTLINEVERAEQNGLQSAFSPDLGEPSGSIADGDELLPITPLSSTRRGQHSGLKRDTAAVIDETRPSATVPAGLTRSWSTKASMASSAGSYPPPSAPPTAPLPPLPLDAALSGSKPSFDQHDDLTESSSTVPLPVPRKSFPPEAAYELVKDAKSIEDMEELLDDLQKRTAGASATPSIGAREPRRSNSRRLRPEPPLPMVDGEGFELEYSLAANLPLRSASMHGRPSAASAISSRRSFVTAASKTFDEPRLSLSDTAHLRRKGSVFSKDGDRLSTGSASTFQTAEDDTHSFSLSGNANGLQYSPHVSQTEDTLKDAFTPQSGSLLSQAPLASTSKVLSAAARYEMAIAGLSPSSLAGQRLSPADSSPLTPFSELFSEPMTSGSSHFSQSTAPSAGSMGARVSASVLTTAWSGKVTQSSLTTVDEPDFSGGPYIPPFKLSSRARLEKLQESKTEEEPLTKQWVEQQRKSVQPRHQSCAELSPSVSSNADSPWEGDGSEAERPKQTIILSTDSRTEGPLFISAVAPLDGSEKGHGPWPQSPLLLDDKNLLSDGNSTSLALGLILGPAVPDLDEEQKSYTLHPAAAEQQTEASVGLPRSSSSLDGFACNVTPPMKVLEEPPRLSEASDAPRPPSGLKNMIATAVLQSPTTPGRISAMFNILGGKAKQDASVSSPVSSKSPISSPPMRQNSTSMRPLALVDKKTKEARRVSLGWHQRTISKDAQCFTDQIASPKGRPESEFSQPPTPPHSVGDDPQSTDHKLASPTAATTAPSKRPSRHIRRVSRLGYVLTEHEIRLEMSGESKEGHDAPNVLPATNFDMIRSPRVASSPTGTTPALAFSPPLSHAWASATRSSPMLPLEPPATTAKNLITRGSVTGSTAVSQPGSPWLDFDGSILASRAIVDSPEMRHTEQLGTLGVQASVRFRGARQSTGVQGLGLEGFTANDLEDAAIMSKHGRSPSLSPFGDHPYHRRRISLGRLSFNAKPDVGRSLRASAIPASVFDTALPSKAMFYAGFLGMPWLWLLGGWWLNEHGQIRVDRNTKFSLWTHEASVQEAREKDLQGSPVSILQYADATFATQCPNESVVLDQSLSVDVLGNTTMGSGTTRTLHTAASRATLGSLYTTGNSSFATISQQQPSRASSSVRIPRQRTASVDSIINPTPEIAFFQSPIRTVPERRCDPLSPTQSSLVEAVRAASTLQILVEDTPGEERRYSELTAAEDRTDCSALQNSITSTAQPRPTPDLDGTTLSGQALSTVQQPCKQQGVVSWSRLERYVLLNRIFAIGSFLVVMAGWSAALFAVAANF
ncbi:hypothetical protein K437DRAFT_45971 [Tilletiaria anomala UBC 951]|uniref:Uncharacterized protein n=1 Tax=Tilletiaria anomala (strain ATCC 24038 / CBS 436.72 / UBC 951) TaxID=1037660 RepID=A0A066WDK3_TILAU|nr:uncharacterized protein K437DRAFT_45971 [Tilletiaria anomala UBC 951]KDN52017.1 hypothetical protein K437DRAFT_45971 [Tilletiaria anomala UBC 951]